MQQQKTCISNMLGQAVSLGCSAGDVACLCSNQNFRFGVRDCTNEHCTGEVDKNAVIQTGNMFCASKSIKQSLFSLGVRRPDLAIQTMPTWQVVLPHPQSLVEQAPSSSQQAPQPPPPFLLDPAVEVSEVSPEDLLSPRPMALAPLTPQLWPPPRLVAR